MEIQTLSKNEVEIILPNWRPGRYDFANYVSNIKNINAKCGDGTQLEWCKKASNKWLIDTANKSTIIVEYAYFANKMDAGSSLVDEEQVYINFINCLFYVEEFINDPTELTLQLPDNFKNISALVQIDKNHFKAVDYYELVDSPVLASPNFNQFSYQVEETEFIITIQGKSPLSEKEIKKTFQKFTVAQIKQMEGFPCKQYHFIIQSLPYKHYHGVEHKNSTVLVLGPNTTEYKRDYYDALIGVASHELFHAWNVTRIRPKELSPYDFSKENYHQTGFVTEGFTTYYGDLFLARSSVLSQNEYFQELNVIFKRHFENYGRHNLSLVESSFDLWIDGYKKLLKNRKVSIYIKGSMVAFMADLLIRKISENEFSLDDVVRDLWQNFGKNEKGYSKQDVYNILLKYGGIEMPAFIQNYYEGIEPIENKLGELLEYIGCNLKAVQYPDVTAAYFGFKLEKDVIVEIAPSSVAEKQLSIGDTILKIDGIKFSEEVLQNLNPAVSFEIERNNKTQTIEIKQGDREYYQLYEIEANKETSKSVIINRNLWLNQKTDS